VIVSCTFIEKHGCASLYQTNDARKRDGIGDGDGIGDVYDFMLFFKSFNFFPIKA
jgi:hypothetical protein